MYRAAGQVGKVLGEKWKALNSKQREPYEEQAKKDKDRYEREKASYNNVSRQILFRLLHTVDAHQSLSIRPVMTMKRRSNGSNLSTVRPLARLRLKISSSPWSQWSFRHALGSSGASSTNIRSGWCALALLAG